MAAPMIRRILCRQLIKYSTFSRARNGCKYTTVTGLTPTVKTALFGTSLAFLGFNVKKETLSEHDQVRKLVSRGINAKDFNNIKEASEAFHEALKLSTDFFKEKKITNEEHLNHRVFIYDQIANMALDHGDFKVAEEVFKQTMKLAVKLGMSETDNAMIEMSLKLAGIYLFTGRVEVGVLGLDYVITEQEKKMKENESKTATDKKVKSDKKVDLDELREEAENTRVLLGKAYQKYGHYHLMVRDFKKAEECMQKALSISKDVMGETDENTLVLMNDLSTCLIMMKEYEKAELMLIDGINESRKCRSLMQSAFLSNLGALYIRVQKYPEAKNACEKGLKIAEKGKDEFMMQPCKNCLEKLAEIEKLSQENKEAATKENDK
ncbi:Tetratricopeptide repeat protein 19 [Mactra antiquata]